MIEGHFVYRELAIAQNPNVYNVFKKLIGDTKPSQILEIGTFHGGLTLMILDIIKEFNLNTKINTYDIEDQQFLKPIVISNNNIKVITKNLFNNDYNDFVDSESRDEVIDFIKSDGTTIVLCDGGNKVGEFNLISSLIKNNDIIMAHDYAPDHEYFQQYIKDKVWNWLEITTQDIIKSLQDNNLNPFMQEEMQSVAWLCVIKQ